MGTCRTIQGRIKAVVTDFDGVMTDNKVIVDSAGREAVVCNRSDGWGISLLKKAGFALACISTERNPVVTARCKKLRISCWQGQSDKLACLKAFCKKRGFSLKEIAYVGNDMNDLECLGACGCAIVPSDAHRALKRPGMLVTRAKGGEGVLREVADLFCSAKNVK